MADLRPTEVVEWGTDGAAELSPAPTLLQQQVGHKAAYATPSNWQNVWQKNVYAHLKWFSDRMVDAVYAISGRLVLSLRGSTGAGGLEFSTAAADANGAEVGALSWSDRNNGGADKRVAELRSLLSGASSNDRGGKLELLLKRNGANGISSFLAIEALDTSSLRATLQGDDGAGVGRGLILRGADSAGTDKAVNNVLIATGASTGTGSGQVQIAAPDPRDKSSGASASSASAYSYVGGGFGWNIAQGILGLTESLDTGSGNFSGVVNCDTSNKVVRRTGGTDTVTATSLRTGATLTTLSGGVVVVRLIPGASAVATFKHEDGTATAALRMICTGAADVAGAAGQTVIGFFFYDATKQRWIMLSNLKY